MKAKLVLQDWTEYTWESFWYNWNTTWEVVFNTWMVWYPELLTDPSYKSQILIATYPLFWNYGIPNFEEVDFFWLKKHFESDKIHLSALIVSEYSANYNHFLADSSLSDFLISQKIPALTWIDTRSLTKKIREEWIMLWKIVFSWEPMVRIKDPNKVELSKEVCCKEIKTYGNWKKKICLLDMWVKNNIIRNLLKFDTTVIRVPHDYKFMDEKLEFDWLFISNWPGNPEKNTTAISQIKKAIEENKNIFWICLGNQLLALSSWAKTYKLKYGHRGQNQPCKDLETNKCIITSQNHSYAIDENTLPDYIEPWFININDKTNEWIKFKEKNIRSVQFHPESDPGPNDSVYLFENFIKSIK